MKTIQNPKKLPLVLGGMGLLALVLRLLVYRIAVDDRGLIQPGHFLVVALWVLTALAAALVLICVWKLDGSSRYGANFPASSEAAFGCGVMALSVMVTVALGGDLQGLGLWRYLLGLASGCCLIFLTYARYRGIKPTFLFHGILCVFFAIHMIYRYRPWSGEPQMMDYFFEMFACVGLTLFSYQQAAFEVGLGKRRPELILGLLTAYCCLAAIPGAPGKLLYLGGAVWTLTNLCSLIPPRRKKAAPEAPRPDAHETA